MMEELNKTKEEIKQAKENAIRLWLSSRPLIEQLERLKIDFECAKNNSTASDNVISEFESQLNSLNTTIKKKEEGLNVSIVMNEITRALDETREEVEVVKIEMDEERRERSKLKRVLKLRKQRLQTLKLRLRAVRLELEAFGASADEAIRYINCSQMDNTTVQLDRDEYSALARKAQEETLLAEWRISVAMEQRPTAEESRDSALRRLRDTYSEKRSRKKKMEEKMTGPGDIGREEEEDLKIRCAFSPSTREKLMPEANQRYPRQQLKRSKGNNNKRIVKKKKPTVLVQIRTFFIRKCLE
ncbi:hypothetical protein LguiA_017505 [Lonicera macranthoides]